MRKTEKKLTADEVRALPVGTRVTYHTRDHRGYPVYLLCEVVQAGTHREVRYDGRWGFERMPIRKGKDYRVEVEDDGDKAQAGH